MLGTNHVEFTRLIILKNAWIVDLMKNSEQQMMANKTVQELGKLGLEISLPYEEKVKYTLV